MPDSNLVIGSTSKQLADNQFVANNGYKERGRRDLIVKLYASLIALIG